MFKAMKLKKMELEARKEIRKYADVFQKYDATVHYISETNHTTIMEKNGMEIIIPFSVTGSFNTDLVNPTSRITSLDNVTLNMNSMYMIAERKKMNPMDVVHEVVSKLVSDIRHGLFPEEKLAIKKPSK